MDVWQMIQRERAALAPRLAALSSSDWDRPSLCANWSVRDVVAHLIATASLTPLKFFGALALHGFRFQKMVDRQISALVDSRSDGDLVELFRRRVDVRTAPPGPTLGWLGETIIHGEDVLRAAGQTGEHPTEHVVAAMNFYKDSNLLIGTKRRIDGVTLCATDTDWRHGTGPEVRGPALALLLAMTGRKVALSELDGEGVELLRERA